MKIKCLFDVHHGISLKKDKIYEARLCKKGWMHEKGFYALVDETGEEYVYPPQLFEIVGDEDKPRSVDENKNA